MEKKRKLKPNEGIFVDVPTKPQYSTLCLACGSSIPIIDPRDNQPQICDECKKAIAFVKQFFNIEKYEYFLR